ncbi:MAG: transposase [candidate division Zixibacteria bacterium]|jgi:putative transposase|nr:transposase [candidate division Zixibacteria bacterium]
MSRLHRHFATGQSYFITIVTHNRQVFESGFAAIWHAAVGQTQSHVDFDMPAWVLMPDHIHFNLSNCATEPSDIIRRIKIRFTHQYKNRVAVSGRVWQHRYWDHVIRNESDYRRHVEYIHFNPVKHGYVKQPILWDESSFGAFAQAGFYEPNWGSDEETTIDGDFGE